MKEIIFVIENENSDFNALTNRLDNFNCYPMSYDDYPSELFSHYQNIKKYVTDTIEEQYMSIKAIIIDISLLGDSDVKGLELIKFIRTNIFKFGNQEKWRRNIPVFCFTNHNTDLAIKELAYDRGVTNYFIKNRFSTNPSGETFFLIQNIFLHKRSFNDIMNYDRTDTEDMMKTLSEITNILIDMKSKTKKILDESFSENIGKVMNIMEQQNIYMNTQFNKISSDMASHRIAEFKYLRMSLVAQLIGLPVEKREIFYDNYMFFLRETLKRKDINAIVHFEEKEKNTKSKIASFFNTSVNGLSFMGSLISLTESDLLSNFSVDLEEWEILNVFSEAFSKMG